MHVTKWAFRVPSAGSSLISSAAWPRANYGFARIAQLCEPITPTTCSETRARPSAQTKSALEGGACERQQKLNEASELVEASKLFAEADAIGVADDETGGWVHTPKPMHLRYQLFELELLTCH
jgi:hypothetical protein